MSDQNLALIFSQIPSGAPVPGQDLTVQSIPTPTLPSSDKPGLTATLLFSSLDPYLRGLLRSSDKKSYFPALPLGGPVLNAGIARVTASTLEGFAEGDLIQGRLPIQRFVALTGDEVKASGVRKVNTEGGPEDLSLYLGVLGMPGLTAYSSLFEIGKPVKGETIFVSSAAGAVGQLVGQLAKREGMRVVGSVGSDEKLGYLTELGFDGGFNYKKEGALEALRRLCPDGVDVYYENVGGEQLEAALEVMNQRGRIVACGMISQYNKKEGEAYGIKNLMLVVGKRLTMRGFIVGDQDMGPKWAQEHQEKVRAWLKDGSLQAKTHAWGIEEADKGFVGMLNGENLGKAVIKF